MTRTIFLHPMLSLNQGKKHPASLSFSGRRERPSSPKKRRLVGFHHLFWYKSRSGGFIKFGSVNGGGVGSSFETLPENKIELVSGLVIGKIFPCHLRTHPPLDFKKTPLGTKSRRTHGLFWPKLFFLNDISFKLLPREWNLCPTISDAE